MQASIYPFRPQMVQQRIPPLCAHHEEVVALGAQLPDDLPQVTLAAEGHPAPRAVDGEGLAPADPADDERDQDEDDRGHGEAVQE